MCRFFNSYEESLHLGVCKLAKYVRNCVIFRKNLHSWQKFYTTVGRDGRDKFQVWTEGQKLNPRNFQEKQEGEEQCFEVTVDDQPSIIVAALLKLLGK